MSYHVFFSFSTGLSQPMVCPKGTLEKIKTAIADTEKALGLVTTQYLDNPKHWDSRKNDEAIKGVDDKVLCETAMRHNNFVRWLYEDFEKWSKNPPEDGETITLDEAKGFWHGLEFIKVSPDRWTPEYYIDRMEHLYEVMRGRDSQGVSFGEKALTEKQAAQVINLFSEYLDSDDRRLDVPRGHDSLASSYDGGYDWCEKCGAVCPDDIGSFKSCKRKCPLKEEYADES